MRHEKNSVVYACRNPENDHVRIGSGNGHRRTGSHYQYGFTELVAALWGDEADETKLHSFFAGDRVPGRKSVYRGAAVYDYLAWLLGREFAVDDLGDLDKLPRLPFSVWAPKEHQADEAYGGQMTILAAMPPPQRPHYAHELAHLSSQSDEWFTPAPIIEAARDAMGGITTDPASHFDAQRRCVQADVWYSKAQNGLRTDLPWAGNVWLNPPYGRGEGSARAFTDRLVRELETGNVQQAITCLNVASSTALWFAPIWDTAALHLVWRGRPDFWLPDKAESSPTKGIILSYFGAHPERFSQHFQEHGTLIVTRD